MRPAEIHSILQNGLHGHGKKLRIDQYNLIRTQNIPFHRTTRSSYSRINLYHDILYHVTNTGQRQFSYFNGSILCHIPNHIFKPCRFQQNSIEIPFNLRRHLTTDNIRKAGNGNGSVTHLMGHGHGEQMKSAPPFLDNLEISV